MAATLMMIIGAYEIFLGITAIARNGFTVVGPSYYYHLNTTAWGWVHIGIGVVVALAGFFLLTGSRIAKFVAIAMLAISALGNFFLLPYFPVWAILLIALDVFAIWAIANVRTDEGALGEADQRAMAGYGGGGYGAQYGTTQAGERWPAENAPAGRHWASENVQEGAQTTQEAQERAAAGRPMPPGPGNRPGGGNPTPPGGQPPPPPPRP